MTLTPLEGITVIMLYISLYAALRAMSYKWRIERLLNSNRELRRRLKG